MTIPSSLRALLSGLIDYAGLFPPARLDMQTAVRNYSAYRRGDHSWMLGRVIIPAARLDEFESAAAGLFPRQRDDEPWQVSLLGSDDPGHDAELIFGFNERHAKTAAGRAVIDTLEVAAGTVAEIEALVRSAPPGVTVYVEIPIKSDPIDLVAALDGMNARAKVRTGGIEPDAFPAIGNLARVIQRTAALGVPFKATAGLHHPLRGMYPLTYEPNSISGTMYGYLNLFLAALFAHAGAGLDELEAILTEGDHTRIRFDEGGVAWGGRRADVDDVVRLRARGATTFGSCSFTEPVDELQALGVTP
ncbi:MAG TPA: hypothetical protein VK012_03265 [Gemmatimonadales bacterium]|nr:hypothetical protein [Gemmatimonadales bacterium]